MLNLRRKVKVLEPAADTACLLPATDNTGTENPNIRAKAHTEANAEGFRMCQARRITNPTVVQG